MLLYLSNSAFMLAKGGPVWQHWSPTNSSQSQSLAGDCSCLQQHNQKFMAYLMTCFSASGKPMPHPDIKISAAEACMQSMLQACLYLVHGRESWAVRYTPTCTMPGHPPSAKLPVNTSADVPYDCAPRHSSSSCLLSRLRSMSWTSQACL